MRRPRDSAQQETGESVCKMQGASQGKNECVCEMQMLDTTRVKAYARRAACMRLNTTRVNANASRMRLNKTRGQCVGPRRSQCLHHEEMLRRGERAQWLLQATGTATCARTHKQTGTQTGTHGASSISYAEPPLVA